MRPSTVPLRAALVAAATVLVWLGAGCGDGDDGDPGVGEGSGGGPGVAVDGSAAATTAHPPGDATAPGPDGEQRYPDVVGVEATDDGGSWTFSVTISSPYDSPERYADAWRVVGPDGTVLGERILTHDHAAEQPFTRSQSGIEIPDDVTTVLVEARDQRYGWGGGVMTHDLPRSDG